MGSNLSLFGKRRMPNGTYGVVRGVRAISPPTRLPSNYLHCQVQYFLQFFLKNNILSPLKKYQCFELVYIKPANEPNQERNSMEYTLCCC